MGWKLLIAAASEDYLGVAAKLPGDSVIIVMKWFRQIAAARRVEPRECNLVPHSGFFTVRDFFVIYPDRKGEDGIMDRVNISIDADMKILWPDTRVGCFQYTVKTEEKNEELWKYLKKDIFKDVRDRIFDFGVNEIPNVRESRAAYKKFGKDPSRYRVSSEALLRRIGQGKGLYQINTVVDVNNLISIESGFSVGSYDLAHAEGDLIFRVGKSGESYKGIGKTELNIEGLPLIADKLGALGSSTSDSERAMITSDTTEVLTLIYSFSDRQALEEAMLHSEEYLKKYAGAENMESWIVE